MFVFAVEQHSLSFGGKHGDVRYLKTDIWEEYVLKRHDWGKDNCNLNHQT